MNNLDPSLTQDILKYLEGQENVFNEEEGLQPVDSNMGLQRVESILNELIQNVADRAQLIEEFQARLKAHNQYPLYDFSTIIDNFFIDDELYEKLTFRESLTISFINRSTLEPVGGLSLDVQLAKGKNPLVRRNKLLEYDFIDLFLKNKKYNVSKTLIEEGTESERELSNFKASLRPPHQERTTTKFLIHVSSKFKFEDHLAGSRITTWLDKNFHTLEEKRSEYVFEGDSNVLNEKTLYCALQPRRYFVKHLSTLEKLDDRKYYSMKKTKHLIGEGGNFVLMRYLAITRYIGEFELSTVYINGDMCRNIYECTGPESDVINGVKLDLCKIYRTIIEECGIVHKCITILSLSGQLIKQEWDDCCFVLHINPLAHVSNEKPTGNEHLKLSKLWEQDMQLFSNYLDSQTTYCMEMKSYLADHSEFKNIISDYVQATLLMKPEKILDFTIKYFKKYYHC